MILDRKFIYSKVWRRLLVLFIICAIFPVLMLAGITFHQVNQSLERQGEVRLHRNSKNMGMAVVENLLCIEDEMVKVFEKTAGGSPPSGEEIRELKDCGLNALRIIGDNEESQGIFGKSGPVPQISQEQRDFVFSGSTLLLESVEGRPRVYMCRALDTGRPELGILAGLIDPSGFLSEKLSKIKPDGSDYWVLNSSGKLLLSSTGNKGFPPIREATAEGRRSGGNLKFKLDGRKYRGYRWDIFLKPTFHLDKWSIVLGEREEDFFAPVADFSQTFLQVILSSLLIVILLSLVQIRRFLVPLNILHRSSRRIAEGDFTCRADVESDDEFKELADSFNLMTKRLAEQFAKLKSIAEISRTALGALDSEIVIKTVLEEFPNIFPCELVNLVLFEQDDSNAAIIYTGEPEADEPTRIKVNINDAEKEELIMNPVYLRKEAGGDSPGYLSVMSDRGVPEVSIFPVFLKGGFSGMILMGHHRTFQYREDEIYQINQVTGHLGVALSNARLVNQLEELNIGTLRALARAIDAKSHWTAGHSERVTEIAVRIGRKLGLSPDELSDLRKGGLLHDIGKIAIPVDILDKPGSLTGDEREIVQKHVSYGVRIVEPINAFRKIIPIIREHHERFDGLGYPEGLRGEEISLYARIFSVADYYDAMTSDRPYRKAMDRVETVEWIRSKAGTYFDSRVVDAFVQVIRRDMNSENDPAAFAPSCET
ncbi:MAG: HD domain-containing protein [Candidatus Krumholzibacteriales bacterium]